MKPFAKLFWIIGIVLLGVVLVSWLAFPNWAATPGGFWLLLAAAAVGGVSLLRNLVATVKDMADLSKKGKADAPVPQPTQEQIMKDSSAGEQIQTGGSATQKQSMTNSPNAKQRQG